QSKKNGIPNFGGSDGTASAAVVAEGEITGSDSATQVSSVPAQSYISVSGTVRRLPVHYQKPKVDDEQEEDGLKETSNRSKSSAPAASVLGSAFAPPSGSAPSVVPTHPDYLAVPTSDSVGDV